MIKAITKIDDHLLVSKVNCYLFSYPCIKAVFTCLDYELEIHGWSEIKSIITVINFNYIPLLLIAFPYLTPTESLLSMHKMAIRSLLSTLIITATTQI